MVAALAALLPFNGAITLFGIPLTTAAGGLTLAGSLVNLAGSALLRGAADALRGSPQDVRPENLQVNSKVAAGQRFAHVGLVKVGGFIVFHRAKAGASYRVIVHGHGEVSEIIATYLDNKPVTLSPTGWVTDAQFQSGGASRVRVLSRAGLIPESSYSEITAIWPEWTANHRGDGLWSSLIECVSVKPEDHRRVFPNGESSLQRLARTRAFPDPRSGLTAYTENAALIIAGYVSDPDGLNRPDAFDPLRLGAEADLCDQSIALAAGGTIPRYRLSGSYALTEEPKAVLGRMLTACAGRLRLRSNGKLDLQVGVWREPEFTLTYDMLTGLKYAPGPDGLDRFNALPARYVDRGLGLIEVDAEIWRDEARIAADGEEAVAKSPADLLMVPHHVQARQVQSILMERSNPLDLIETSWLPAAYPARFENQVRLDLPQFGLQGVFEVVNYATVLRGGLLAGINLTLARVRQEAFAITTDQQGLVQELPPADVPDGVPVPVIVAAAAVGTQVSANTFVAGIGVAWLAPPSDALTPVLRYAETGTNQFRDATVVGGATNAVIAGLIDGAGYDIRLSFTTSGAVFGASADVTNVTALAATAPPVPPSGLAVADAGGGVALVTLTAASTANLWKTEIYRDAVLIASDYAAPGQPIALSDVSGAGTFDWTARSVNVSGLVSSPTAAVTQTIA